MSTAGNLGLPAAEQSLRQLRQEFRQIQRKAQRIKANENRVWYPTDEIKPQAVLIMLLTDDM